MTNFEKYKDTLKTIADRDDTFSVVKGKPYACGNTKCKDCSFKIVQCNVGQLKWLLEEHE